LAIADTKNYPDVLLRRVVRADGGFRSVVYVPLKSSGNSIGAIAVGRKAAGPFAAHHVELLQTFADQAVIAIENVRLFNETREALERQTATADILKVIASSPSNVQPVFETIAESAKRLLGSYHAVVTRVIDDKVHLAAFTAGGEEGDRALQSRFPMPPSGPGPNSRAARTGLAQNSPAPTFNFRLQSERATAKLHHPERGAVGLEELRSIGTSRPGLPLNRYLSFFVSDVETMSQIKFSEVMEQLASQSGDPLLTKEILFHQWWDSAGQRPGQGLGPHCDDESAASGDVGGFNALSTLNGFPYRCPRLEVAEASSDPFTNEVDTNPSAYSAIAFSNRFDLVDDAKNPTDCGEYRIVFARNSGKLDALNRNLVIFEARVANSKPADGLQGCRPILDFWRGCPTPRSALSIAELSYMTSISKACLEFRRS